MSERDEFGGYTKREAMEMMGMPVPPPVSVDEMTRIIADAARASDAAHWPEAVARALISDGYKKEPNVANPYRSQA